MARCPPVVKERNWFKNKGSRASTRSVCSGVTSGKQKYPLVDTINFLCFCFVQAYQAETRDGEGSTTLLDIPSRIVEEISLIHAKGFFFGARITYHPIHYWASLHKVSLFVSCPSEVRTDNLTIMRPALYHVATGRELIIQ